jgi:hypothetical protein
MISDYNSVNRLEYSGCPNELHKLAKMNISEIREYVNTNYPRSKANFFMKYKLPQYTIFLSNPQT